VHDGLRAHDLARCESSVQGGFAGRLQLIEGAAQAFNGASPQPEVDLIPLQAKIGQLTLENDFLERALTKAGLLSAKK
jgi:hypothetical protein